MARRVWISAEEATPVTRQITRPCSDCPWRRDALEGWLGSMTARDWIDVALSEATADCHAHTGEIACAGLAIFRSNIAKRLRDPDAFRVDADRRAVFATPLEFLAYHGGDDK